jgi:hypothetical protein
MPDLLETKKIKKSGLTKKKERGPALDMADSQHHGPLFAFF